MTNGQIHCFVTVVDEGSFAKAANTLFISQPAISKSISKLEDELGFSLLDRRRGTLRPTAAGRKLYQYFKKSQHEFLTLLNELQTSLQHPEGTIRLGCPETWNPAHFYETITGYFAAQYPTMELIIECCRLPELLARLQAGKLDIIMTHEFYPPIQYGLTVRHLTDTGCGILYSNAFFEDIRSLSDLKNVEFLTFDSDIEKKFGSVVKRICSEHGFSPTIRNCGHYSASLFDLSCGKGVMFFTAWDIAVTNSAFTYLPLDYKSPGKRMYPSVSSNPKTQLFADELAELFRNSLPEPHLG